MYSNIYLRMNNNNNNILNDRAAQWAALLGSVDDIIKNNNIDDIYDPVIIDNLKDKMEVSIIRKILDDKSLLKIQINIDTNSINDMVQNGQIFKPQDNF